MPTNAVMRRCVAGTAMVLAACACLGASALAATGSADLVDQGAGADGWTITGAEATRVVTREKGLTELTDGPYPLPPDLAKIKKAGQGLVCWARSPAGRHQFELIGEVSGNVRQVRSNSLGTLAAIVVPDDVKQLKLEFGQAAAEQENYTLTCSATEVGQTILKSGYAVKYEASRDEYLDVYGFARPVGDDSERRVAWAKASAVRTLLAKIVGGDVFNGEPVVLFVGTAGLARILIVDKDGVRPERDNLDSAKAIWTAYIEDDSGPYETSVDVQFNRSSRIKYDQFEPGTTPLSTAAALDAEGQLNPAGKSKPAPQSGPARMVRVGIKRIPLSTLPMSMQVAFTRQGGLYGFRQWQKSLRIRRWEADVSVSVFVPAAEVTLNTHALAPTDFPIDGSPDFNVIVQESRRRQVFAALRLGWPGVRAATDDAPKTSEALKTAWIPDLVVGIGIPPTRATAAYVGLSWPVPRVPRLHLTAGASVLWQSRLMQRPCYDQDQTGNLVASRTDLLSVGCKVPLPWSRRDIVKGGTPVGEFVFGVIVDLFTWP